MAKNYFSRYIWLIDTIQKHGYITFSDISDLWEKSALNEDGSALPERTFFNQKDAILDVFGIEIKFDKTLGYYLADNELDTEGIRSWLLASLSVHNLINESSQIRGRVLFEDIPSGQRFLSVIIEAMKEGKVLEMTYQKFQDSEEKTFNVAPYCVKVFKQRWYMVAEPLLQKKDALMPRTFALDRIHSLEQTRMNFKVPDGFNANAYYSGCFGIVHDDDSKIETVRLKVYDKQRHYLRTLPLHKSQIEVETQEGWSVFEYRMAPSWDFEQELLQYSDSIEVLEPQSLRNMMIEHAWNLLHLYKEA